MKVIGHLSIRFILLTFILLDGKEKTAMSTRLGESKLGWIKVYNTRNKATKQKQRGRFCILESSCFVCVKLVLNMTLYPSMFTNITPIGKKLKIIKYVKSLKLGTRKYGKKLQRIS